MTATWQALHDVAKSELGYTEEPFQPGELHVPGGTNRTKFAAEAGHTNGLPWCATFEVALAHRVGLELPPGCNTASVWWNLNAWQKAGRSPTVPEPGDFVHFRIGDGHTGILEEIVGDMVTTIDGNTLPDGRSGDETNGGVVCRKTRHASLVAGYGRPDYLIAPVPSEDEPMLLTASCQWLAANDDGTEPHLLAVPDGDHRFILTSVHGGPLAPAFAVGQTGDLGPGVTFEDFVAGDTGLWARRVIGTTGPLEGFLTYVDHVSVACAGGGVYRIAHA